MRPELKKTLRAVIAVWNGADPALLRDTIREDFTYYHYWLSAPLRGRLAFLGHMQAIRTAFPDLVVKVEEAFAEDDKLVVKWHWSGTHRAPFRGYPPTGKKVSQHGISIVHLKDDMAFEEYCVADVLSLVKQLEGVAAPLHG